MSSPRSNFVACILLLLAFSSTNTMVLAQTSSLMPIPSPTLPVGSNPQVTAIPASQGGSLGPTTQVLTQSFGQTFSPAPSSAAEKETNNNGVSAPTADNQETNTNNNGVSAPTADNSASYHKTNSMPPSLQVAATVGMTGVAAALL